ncbi:MAG: hypothetical protein LBP54_01935 [Campylobacteraceae bacterium]|jgi:hypothetical protein|nr:hypothetical protein [Campylobacteraceae bacterium]
MEVKIINANTKPLENLLLIAQHKQQLLKDIGNHLENVIGESFENEKSPAGRKWKANVETKELRKTEEVARQSRKWKANIETKELKKWKLDAICSLCSQKIFLLFIEFVVQHICPSSVKTLPPPFLPPVTLFTRRAVSLILYPMPPDSSSSRLLQLLKESLFRLSFLKALCVFCR